MSDSASSNNSFSPHSLSEAKARKFANKIKHARSPEAADKALNEKKGYRHIVDYYLLAINHYYCNDVQEYKPLTRWEPYEYERVLDFLATEDPDYLFISEGSLGQDLFRDFVPPNANPTSHDWLARSADLMRFQSIVQAAQFTCVENLTTMMHEEEEEENLEDKNANDVTEEEWMELARKQEKEMRKNGTYYATKYKKEDKILYKKKGWKEIKKGIVTNINPNKKRSKVTYDIKIDKKINKKRVKKENQKLNQTIAPAE